MTLRRYVCATLLLAGATFARAEEAWSGIFLQGQKIGHTQTVSSATKLDGADVTLRRSVTNVSTEMLGSGLTMKVESSTWLDKNGRILRLEYQNASAGRTLHVTGQVHPDRIVATMKAGGEPTTKVVPLPSVGRLSDDPLTDLLANGGSLKTTSFNVFAPESLSLVTVTLADKGTQEITDKGKKVSVRVVEINDPRAKTTAYFSPDGKLVKSVGPFGMEVRPLTKEEALSKAPAGTVIDLASASAIKLQGRLTRTQPKANLLFTSGDLSHLPSDDHQKVSKNAQGWLVIVGPVRQPVTETTIAASAIEQPDWVKPEPRIPSDSEQFRKLAASIVGEEKRAVPAAEKLRSWVHRQMGVNLGIGVLRDATEILESKEGVCRDHAVLLGTLTRAAGIPTKFANGIVFDGREFYYHAWVEVWDGTGWVGLDSTVPEARLTATHVKTAVGSLADAQTGFLIDGASITVVED